MTCNYCGMTEESANGPRSVCSRQQGVYFGIDPKKFSPDKQRIAELEAENERLRTFAKNIRDNFDCDSDGHKYGTYCRSCDAAKVLESEAGQ